MKVIFLLISLFFSSSKASTSQYQSLALRSQSLEPELGVHTPYFQNVYFFENSQPQEESMQPYYNDLENSYSANAYSGFSMPSETGDNIFLIWSEIEGIKKEINDYNQKLSYYSCLKNTIFEEEKSFFNVVFSDFKKELLLDLIRVEKKNEDNISKLCKRLLRLELIIQNNKRTEDRVKELEKSVQQLQEKDRLNEKRTEKLSSIGSRMSVACDKIKKMEDSIKILYDDQKIFAETKKILEKKYNSVELKMSDDLKKIGDQINEIKEQVKNISFSSEKKEVVLKMEHDSDSLKELVPQHSLPQEIVDQKNTETAIPEKQEKKKDLHQIMSHPHIIEIVFLKKITETTLPTFIFFLKKSMISFSTFSIIKNEESQNEAIECLQYLISSEFHCNSFFSLKSVLDVFFKIEKKDFEKIENVIVSTLNNCFSLKIKESAKESAIEMFNFSNCFLEHINSELNFYSTFFKKVEDKDLLIFFCNFFDQVIEYFSKVKVKNKNPLTIIGASKTLEKIKIKISLVEYKKIPNSESRVLSLENLLENLNIDNYISVFDEVLCLPQKLTNLDLITIKILLTYIEVLETFDIKKKDIFQKIFTSPRISKEKILMLKKIILNS